MTVSTIRGGVADRRMFIGGSVARIIMGKDEGVFARASSETRGPFQHALRSAAITQSALRVLI